MCENRRSLPVGNDHSEWPSQPPDLAVGSSRPQKAMNAFSSELSPCPCAGADGERFFRGGAIREFPALWLEGRSPLGKEYGSLRRIPGHEEPGTTLRRVGGGQVRRCRRPHAALGQGEFKGLHFSLGLRFLEKCGTWRACCELTWDLSTAVG
jgi:hypothetical protein